MGFSERNTKVARARWAKVHAREKENFASGTDAAVMRAALCGFLAGDGCVFLRHEGKKVRYIIKFFPDDNVMLQTYLLFFRKLYGKKPAARAKINYYEVQITSRAVYEDLLSSARFGLHAWSPPLVLFTEEKIAWLRGFFSAEAYVSSKAIRIQTVNEAGMCAVSNMLNELAIGHRRYVYRPKKTAYSTVHIIVICRRENRRRFADLVGFWHAKKTVALAKSLHLKEGPESGESSAAIA